MTLSGEPEPGIRVGEYVLDEPLGAGGFATVWRAHHHAFPDRQVAAKLLRDPERASMLRDEAECLTKLDHPAIPSVVGMDLDHNPPYLLLELTSPRTLRDLMEAEGPLPPARAYAVFSQLVSALAHSHGLGIAHGDLKPENVLIDEADRVTLTDFGLGRRRASEASLLLSGNLDTRPEDASLAGTIPYMAPEQREGQAADPTSDVFALGILLYEMLTGQRPQPGDHPAEHLSGRPPEWLQVWDRCYTRRDRRLKDAGEVADTLGLARRAALPEEAPPVPAARSSGPWALEELERAVAREAGLRLAELLAPREAPRGMERLLSWAEEQVVSDRRRIAEARHLVWLLATGFLRTPVRDLAERYQVSVVELQRGIAAARAGRIGLALQRGVVERLAPLPPDLVHEARKVSGWVRGLRMVGALAVWAASLPVLLTGLILLAFSAAAGAVFLALAAVLGVLGYLALQRERSREAWIEGHLDQVPGLDRRERLITLALHTELGAISRTARRVLRREELGAGVAVAVTAPAPGRELEPSPTGEAVPVPQPTSHLAPAPAVAPRTKPTPDPEPDAPLDDRPSRIPLDEAIRLRREAVRHREAGEPEPEGS